MTKNVSVSETVKIKKIWYIFSLEHNLENKK